MTPNQVFSRNESGRTVKGSMTAITTANCLLNWPDGRGLNLLTGCNLSCSRSRMSLVI